MKKEMIYDLRIGQKIKFDRGIGEIVRISEPLFQNYDEENDACLVVRIDDGYYNCTIEEVELI